MHSRAVTDAPRISVLISSYNNARFVEKKLAEIKAQTGFARAEFLFIETASPERERELFAPFCRQHPNCRLLATEERQTLYQAWNLGWREARAPILCYSNMDDTMHPRLLEEVVTAMEREKWDACSVLIAKQLASDPHLNDWSSNRLRRLKLNIRPGPFTAWRTELADSVRMFDGEFVAAGDLDFWSRLVSHKCRIGLVPKILYLYTKSAEQLSKSDRPRRARDKVLLEGKPYQIGWHRGWRRRVFWLRYVARVFPNLFCLPANT
ncbi:MAG TPA: glycosyltransferase [Verrucomicrobiae bacterium]|jgi:glycosyltransferase involved in cell wall biosynthesis